VARSLVQPFALGPGEGFAVANPTGAVTTFKAMADACGGTITAIEGSAAPGEGPPLHVHPRQDELIYTLEGMHRVKLGDHVFDAPVGTFVFIPRGTSLEGSTFLPQYTGVRIVPFTPPVGNAPNWQLRPNFIPVENGGTLVEIELYGSPQSGKRYIYFEGLSVEDLREKHLKQIRFDSLDPLGFRARGRRPHH